MRRFHIDRGIECNACHRPAGVVFLEPWDGFAACREHVETVEAMAANYREELAR